MQRKIAAVLLILIGLAIVSYPLARDAYFEYQQRKLAELWQADLQQIDGDAAIEYTMAQPAIDLTKEMEGLLIIDKIKLTAPILTGITNRNLNLSVASVEKTGRPGEPGNYCIAGHRSRSYGLLFNRLNELAVGDDIVVQTEDQTFVYQVTASKVVKPENVELLKPDGDRKLITLITCDYSVKKPYLRLIVTGELEE
ncbi:MAG: class D sortase [Syntrophomonadaceae bacterium]|nr:class D sortase [Syntrophomonadaceae bacterium]